MGLKEREFNGIFANILSDGTIRVKCDENDPKAVRREWETKDGSTGVKFERVYQELSGFIQGIEFRDGEFGKLLVVRIIDDAASSFILNMAMASNFAEDFLKKLPNVNISKEITLRPYSFIDKKTGKNRKGMAINQNEEEIKNYFTEYDIETKKTTFKFDFPKPDQTSGQFDSEDWKIYFAQCRKFLQRFTEENIIPTLIENTHTNAQIETVASGEEVINNAQFA